MKNLLFEEHVRHGNLRRLRGHIKSGQHLHVIGNGIKGQTKTKNEDETFQNYSTVLLKHIQYDYKTRAGDEKTDEKNR